MDEIPLEFQQSFKSDLRVGEFLIHIELGLVRYTATTQKLERINFSNSTVWVRNVDSYCLVSLSELIRVLENGSTVRLLPRSPDMVSLLSLLVR